MIWEVRPGFLDSFLPGIHFPSFLGSSFASSRPALKDISPKCSLEGLMLKLRLQSFGYLMWRTDSLEKTLMLGKTEGRRRRGQERMRWLDSITDLMEVSLSKLLESVKNRDARHTAVHEIAKSWTWLSGWAEQASPPRQLVTFVFSQFQLLASIYVTGLPVETISF